MFAEVGVVYEGCHGGYPECTVFSCIERCNEHFWVRVDVELNSNVSSVHHFARWAYSDASAHDLDGQDEVAVREVFTPGVLSHFAEHPMLDVEADGDTLIVYRAGKRISPRRVEACVCEVLTISLLFG